MSLAVWPSLLVAGAAWVIVCLRLRELIWLAPIDAEPFARELTRSLVRGDIAQALALCAALPAGWGSELALRALRANATEHIALGVAGAELSTEFAHAAQRGIDVLRALGRIAIPLALGSAILALGAGFQTDATGGAAFAAAQEALQAASHALTVGAATTVFCRFGVQAVQQQSAARLAEVRQVARALDELAPAA